MQLALKYYGSDECGEYRAVCVNVGNTVDAEKVRKTTWLFYIYKGAKEYFYVIIMGDRATVKRDDAESRITFHFDEFWPAQTLFLRNICQKK